MPMSWCSSGVTLRMTDAVRVEDPVAKPQLEPERKLSVTDRAGIAWVAWKNLAARYIHGSLAIRRNRKTVK